MNAAWQIPFQPRGPLLFVAGGPSSDRLADCLGFGAIAVVNQSLTLVPGTVDWLVAADLEALHTIRDHWPRVGRFLVSERLHVNAADSPVSPAWLPGFPVDRWVSFPIAPIVYTDEETRNCIRNDTHAALCNAACAGLHLFARMGYSPIWLLGHDGGFGYGADYAAKNVADSRRDFRPIRARLELIAHCLTEKFGTEVLFWPASPVPSQERRTPCAP